VDYGERRSTRVSTKRSRLTPTGVPKYSWARWKGATEEQVALELERAVGAGYGT
jgi:hypothetical protein